MNRNCMKMIYLRMLMTENVNDRDVHRADSSKIEQLSPKYPLSHKHVLSL